MNPENKRLKTKVNRKEIEMNYKLDIKLMKNLISQKQKERQDFNRG